MRFRVVNRWAPYLLDGVELDPGAAVPDADEVVQPRADDARGGAHQRGDVASVTVNMADAAPRQDVPQADGAVLPAARENHCLGGESQEDFRLKVSNMITNAALHTGVL